jgi:hypothetical protein
VAGLQSVGVVHSIEAINGIGHATVMCDPDFRSPLASHGYTLDPRTGEVDQLGAYVGSFCARAAQITRNIDRYEAQWRREHPEEEPGPRVRRAWDRRAWAQARPDGPGYRVTTHSGGNTLVPAAVGWRPGNTGPTQPPTIPPLEVLADADGEAARTQLEDG